MKLKRYVALLLALIMLLGVLVGCAAKGQTLITLKKEKISVNTFYLYLSRLKGYLSTANAYGLSAEEDSFWDTLMSTDGTTYDQYYTAQILENAKLYAAALHAFRERGLKLPKETVKEIDKELQEIIDTEWDGSKTEFNKKLATYGVNYDVLREAKIIEAKIALLRADLFGADGSKISAQLKEDYYRTNYRHFKQMFFYTGYFETVLDEEGNEKVVTGSDGYPVFKNMTQAEINLVIDRTTEAFDKAVVNDVSFLDAWKNGKTAMGDAILFDALLDEKNKEDKYVYTEDPGRELYPNGIYLKADSDYDFPEVRDAVFEMEVGEIRVIRSDYGFHVIMRYENDAGAYANEANKDCFGDFATNLENLLLEDYLRPYLELIAIDQKVFEGVSMKNVAANLHY